MLGYLYSLTVNKLAAVPRRLARGYLISDTSQSRAQGGTASTLAPIDGGEEKYLSVVFVFIGMSCLRYINDNAPGPSTVLLIWGETDMRINPQIGLRSFRNLRRDIRLFFLSWFCFTFCFAGMTGVLLNLYLLRLGLDAGIIGVVNGTIFISFSGFSFPAGILGKRVKIRSLMAAGLILIVVGYGIILSAETAQGAGFAALLISGAALLGLGSALYIVCSLPFLMTCRSENKNRVFSFRTAMQILGSSTGSLIAGVLPRAWSHILRLEPESPPTYRLSIGIVVPILCVALFAVSRIRAADIAKERIGTKAGESGASRRPVVLILIVAAVTLLMTVGDYSVRTFFNVFTDQNFGMPSHTIGLVVGLARVLGLPAVAVSAILVRKRGPRIIVIFGLLLSAVWMTLFIVGGSAPVAVVIGLFLFSATMYLVTPAFDLYHQSIVPAEHRPVMSGAYTAAFGLGGSAIMFAGGFVISFLGFAWMFALAAAFMLAGALIFAASLQKVTIPVERSEV